MDELDVRISGVLKERLSDVGVDPHPMSATLHRRIRISRFTTVGVVAALTIASVGFLSVGYSAFTGNDVSPKVIAPVATPSSDPQPCTEPASSATPSEKDEELSGIYAVVVKRALNKPVLASVQRLNLFDRAPKKVGNLQDDGPELSPELQARILERLEGWAQRHDLDVRFCSTLVDEWLMLSRVRIQGDIAQLEAAHSGGSLDYFLRKKNGRWVIRGTGGGINY